MSVEDKAPVPPAAGDQGTDQPKPEGSQPPVDTDQAGDSLYSEDEIKGLPPEAEKRVKGMQSRFTKSTQELAEEKKQLAAERAAIREELAALREERESLRQSPATEPAPVQSRIDRVLASYPERDREALKTIYEEAVAEASRKVVPMTEEAKMQAAFDRAESKYSDFSALMTPQNIRALTARFPGIKDPEAAYKIIKHDILAGEIQRKDGELSKFQTQAKRQAQTEQPIGPSAETNDLDWYENMPKAERKKLTLAQIYEKSLRHQRAAGR